MTPDIAGREITIDAAPQPITLTLPHTAVIVVDKQNDFVSQGGMFDCAGIDLFSVQQAVDPIRRVLFAARSAQIRIVYLKMASRPDLSDLGEADSPNRVRHLHFGVGQPSSSPVGHIGRFLIRDTWNTDVIDALQPEPGDPVLYKHRFSGFYQTELHDLLQKSGIKNLVFTGCTTNVCVDSTLRDAMLRDYKCVLLADCTGEPIGSGLPRTNHDAALLVIQTLFGWVSRSEEFIHALEAPMSNVRATRTPAS